MTPTRPRPRPQFSAMRLRKLAAASVALSTALILSACSSNSNDNTPADASSVPTPTVSADRADPVKALKKEAISAYENYWREMEKLYADKDGGANLQKYAASAALKNATADAKRAHDQGLVNIGDVRLIDPSVTRYEAKGQVPNATVSSCLDISRWETVKASTKKPVTLPSNRLTKYVIVSTLEKWPEGWRVTRDEPQGKPC
ncbi:hypothetical protein [Streptomyces sp. NPDC029554]|uniref:hypothetical protein n=1 Tax=Streptomyces sp. NPDC029554 TaxID=3155126 RepID=UPI0033F64EB1